MGYAFGKRIFIKNNTEETKYNYFCTNTNTFDEKTITYYFIDSPLFFGSKQKEKTKNGTTGEYRNRC